MEDAYFLVSSPGDFSLKVKVLRPWQTQTTAFPELPQTLPVPAVALISLCADHNQDAIKHFLAINTFNVPGL